ncbi:MAG: FkbM family methyltransferase [Fuerstiella sp.]|nr:FkbM family methyltransferase [Fuerstiella sp.]
MGSAARQLSTKLIGFDIFPSVWPEKYSANVQLMRRLVDVRNDVRNLAGDGQTRFLQHCLQHVGLSYSQIFQDLFVQYVLGEKHSGFFCEFGATDGVELSNSYMLETHYGWKGICAEPARGWHEQLRRNRPNASVETDCVWTTTGEKLRFNEVDSRELSTINLFSNDDGHARKRSGRQSTTYEVSTISLNDLLAKYDAPREFDYLSIDTEGSELSILEKVDYSRYCPRVITVEHNFTENREGIFRLLSGQGYRRVFKNFSGFDDWYLSESVTFDQD